MGSISPLKLDVSFKRFFKVFFDTMFIFLYIQLYFKGLLIIHPWIFLWFLSHYSSGLFVYLTSCLFSWLDSEFAFLWYFVWPYQPWINVYNTDRVIKKFHIYLFIFKMEIFSPWMYCALIQSCGPLERSSVM